MGAAERQRDLARDIERGMGEAFEIRVAGIPGDRVFLLESDEPTVLPLGPSVGVLHLELSLASRERFLGTLPASGTLAVPTVAPYMKAGIESRMRSFQLVVEGSRAPYLSNPVGSLLIDESF